MSVVSIPIVNKNYPMGCEDGQEGRLVELGPGLASKHVEPRSENRLGALYYGQI